ncbi:MAG TPA: hypothetical protein VHJ76_05190 [Actinomycetota bacterium]|nr:hypothetical protein [Actinomycetota bacterium]
MANPFPIDPNEHDRFILRQKLRMVINEYEFSLPGPDGESPGQVFCFVSQKRFKFKEDIRFYTDASKSTEVMRLKARQRFDPTARYDITDSDGSPIGQIQKVFGKSLLRSTFTLFDASGAETATAREKSMPVAIFRRIVHLIPWIENFANWLPIPYHFVFRRGETELGHHRRHLWKFGDVYTIDMSPDGDRTVDRRLVLATAVGMDALQAR